MSQPSVDKGHKQQAPRFDASASDVEKVSKQWDTAAAQRQTYNKLMGWLDSPIVQAQYVLPATAPGGSRGNWMADFVAEMGIVKNGRWLSLGCGSGGQEMYAVDQKLCARLDAYDISPQSIAQATQTAKERGLSNIYFDVGNFHEIPLPKHQYDVVIMSMSLHHVAELNRLLPRLGHTLKPGGWFLVNEYVGPAQFQYSPKTLEIVADILALLPDRLRYDYVHQKIKEKYVMQPREYWFLVDPSEAICSDHIESALHRYFHVRAQHDYGGSYINLLLEHIVGNFDPENEGDVMLIRLLGYFEKRLIQEGVLENCFALFAMQPKSGFRFLTLLSLPFQFWDKARIAIWKRDALYRRARKRLYSMLRP